MVLMLLICDLQIDSDLLGRIPLCTYVIDNGKSEIGEKSGTAGNKSSPIIHPEFGCVTCKVKVIYF